MEARVEAIIVSPRVCIVSTGIYSCVLIYLHACVHRQGNTVCCRKKMITWTWMRRKMFEDGGGGGDCNENEEGGSSNFFCRISYDKKILLTWL